MLFPRWTGPDSKPPMLLSKFSLVNYINSYNGRRQCLVSIYAFTTFRNHKPNISTAMIDTLYVRGNLEEMLGHMSNLDLKQIMYNAYYDGNEILILVPLGHVVDFATFKRWTRAPFLNFTFSTRTWDLMLWPGTWNPKTKKYVIEVRTEDEIEDLPEMASKPIKRPKKKGVPIRSLYKQ